jgi:hypothetical protein
VLDGIVGEVKVVGEGGELGGDGVNLLDEWVDVGFPSELTDGELG